MMASKPKLKGGGYFRAWIWQHIMRKQVVWLESTTFGDSRLWLTYVNRFGKVYVYPAFKIGSVILNKDGTTGGKSIYIKYWKPYKRGINYRRPTMSPNDPNGYTNITLNSNFISANGTSLSAKSLQNLLDGYTTSASALGFSQNQIQIAPVPIAVLTPKQKVDQLNAEMMKNHRANLRNRTAAV